MRHVVFRVQKERYALPLAAVREVVVPPPVFSRVPRAPQGLRGVMNLRGRVVTVVELARLLGLSQADPAGQILLLDRGRRDLGLLASAVEGIESIERISPPPKDAQPLVAGLSRVGGWAVGLLDPEGLDAAVTALIAGARVQAGK